MKLKFTISFLLFMAVGNVFLSQRGGQEEIDPNAAFRLELAEYRKDCRNSIKPYRYEGMVTTYFSYKGFNYVKEIEVPTNQRAKYKISINAKGIHHGKIHMRIYDKPSKNNGRFLLYEKQGVGGGVFEVEVPPLLEKLKEHKKAKGVDQGILDVMRLKKVYIDYVIPGVDRETETDEETGKEKVVLKKGAIVCAIGYSVTDY